MVVGYTSKSETDICFVGRYAHFLHTHPQTLILGDRHLPQYQYGMSAYLSYSGPSPTYLTVCCHHTSMLGLRGRVEAILRRDVLSSDLSIHLHAIDHACGDWAPPGAQVLYMSSRVAECLNALHHPDVSSPYQGPTYVCAKVPLQEDLRSISQTVSFGTAEDFIKEDRFKWESIREVGTCLIQTTHLCTPNSCCEFCPAGMSTLCEAGVLRGFILPTAVNSRVMVKKFGHPPIASTLVPLVGKYHLFRVDIDCRGPRICGRRLTWMQPVFESDWYQP